MVGDKVGPQEILDSSTNHAILLHVGLQRISGPDRVPDIVSLHELPLPSGVDFGLHILSAYANI